MILAIISFAIEIVFVAVVNASKDITKGFAILTIVMFAICTITSFSCIFYNFSRMKNYLISKGITVTGLVFSIVGFVIGMIFFIAFFAGLAKYL